MVEYEYFGFIEGDTRTLPPTCVPSCSQKQIVYEGSIRAFCAQEASWLLSWPYGPLPWIVALIHIDKFNEIRSLLDD